MNFLKLITKPTDSPDSFVVYWTNTAVKPKGAILVHVPLPCDDKPIIAELFAMQHLLEEREVLGRNLAGNPNAKLIFSLGACKKLRGKKSAKAHLAKFAHFLTTRFKESPIEVDKDERWLSDHEMEPGEELTVERPMGETVHLHGMGQIKITSHVVERFAERLTGLRLQQSGANAAPKPINISDAWRRLRQITSDIRIIEVQKTGILSKIQNKYEGRYFQHPSGWLFVVSNNSKEPSLVTVYQMAA